MKMFRGYHLFLAFAVASAYFSAERLAAGHAWFGYVAAVLLAIRAALGFAGNRGFDYRRLNPFAARAGGTLTGIRHPAIGAVLTLALLALVASAATTGMLMDRGGTLIGQSIREERGEFAPAPSRNLKASLRERPNEGDDEGEYAEGLLAEVHETSGNLLLPLALLHIFYMLAFKLPLARFMMFFSPKRSSNA